MVIRVLCTYTYVITRYTYRGGVVSTIATRAKATKMTKVKLKALSLHTLEKS